MTSFLPQCGRGIFALLAAIVFLPANAAAQHRAVYKCQTSNGVVLQDIPCVAGEQVNLDQRGRESRVYKCTTADGTTFQNKRCAAGKEQVVGTPQNREQREAAREAAAHAREERNERNREARSEMYRKAIEAETDPAKQQALRDKHACAMDEARDVRRCAGDLALEREAEAAGREKRQREIDAAMELLRAWASQESPVTIEAFVHTIRSVHMSELNALLGDGRQQRVGTMELYYYNVELLGADGQRRSYRLQVEYEFGRPPFGHKVGEVNFFER
jgi:hypothetical protein